MIKNKLSFVQGRLSPQVGSNYQYFPIDNWHNELKIAKKIGIQNIEWIISDLSNPIFNIKFIKFIKSNLKESKVNISSISLDFLMNNPIHTQKIEDLNWLIKKLNIVSKNFDNIRLNIPVEESSTISNSSELKNLQKKLFFLKKKLSRNFLISLETDISPKNLKILLRKKNLRGIGINVDIGNVVANGYNIQDYFLNLTDLIYGIHLKNRSILFSKSQMLKNTSSLNFAIKNLSKLKNLHDITLQTYKDNYNYKKQFIYNLKFIKKKLKDHEKV